jgi:hypothetical protein
VQELNLDAVLGVEQQLGVNATWTSRASLPS